MFSIKRLVDASLHMLASVLRPLRMMCGRAGSFKLPISLTTGMGRLLLTVLTQAVVLVSCVCAVSVFVLTVTVPYLQQTRRLEACSSSRSLGPSPPYCQGLVDPEVRHGQC